MNDEKIMPNPQFPYEETLKYIKLAQSGDREAMNELVERNMALVRSIVKKYLNRGTEYDDLYQIGSMGLVKAIKNFDSSYGVRFSTYAVPMIAGEIKRFLRDDGRPAGAWYGIGTGPRRAGNSGVHRRDAGGYRPGARRFTAARIHI